MNESINVNVVQTKDSAQEMDPLQSKAWYKIGDITYRI